ncbi:MAG TPA: amidohydrolase family protein [Ignavibacteria bacterium]
MEIKYILFALFLTLILSSCSKKPDALYINGKIHTLDENNTIVEAVAVRNGLIIDLGTTKEISEKYGPENIINLENNTVIPGLIDCDGSLVEFSKNFLYTVYLNNVKSLQDLRSKIKNKSSDLSNGDWIVFYNLNMTDSLIEKINKNFIDEVAKEINVVLVDSLKILTIINSKGIETLQITNLIPDPKNGEIQKDKKGNLTGLFFDDAQKLIYENIPELNRKQVFNSVEKGSKELLRYGITEIHDRTIGKEAIELLKELIDSNKLSVKVYGVLTGSDEGFEDYLKKGLIENYKDKLTVRAVSLDYDGAFELQEASMNDEYKTEPKVKQPYIDEKTINDVFTKAIDKNFQFRIKVVGDKGLSEVLTALDKIIKSKNPKDHRTILEYVEFTNPPEINKMKELNIIPSLRPETTINDIENLPNLLSNVKLRNIGLWKTLLQSSGKFITGSGFPFENQINPFLQMYFLVSGKSLDSDNNKIQNPEQKISILDAIKSYTIWAAYSAFEEKIKGSIEKGKVADMVVLSDDIFVGDTNILLKVKALKTIINGKVVYDYTK